MARIDKERDMHWQAWLNQQVGAMKNVGTEKNPNHEPVFKNFNEFFDYEKAIKELGNPRKQKSNLTEKQKRMARTAAILNAKGG